MVDLKTALFVIICCLCLVQYLYFALRTSRDELVSNQEYEDLNRTYHLLVNEVWSWKERIGSYERLDDQGNVDVVVDIEKAAPVASVKVPPALPRVTSPNSNDVLIKSPVSDTPAGKRRRAAIFTMDSFPSYELDSHKGRCLLLEDV